MPEHFKNVKLVNLAGDGGRAGADLYFERADVPPATDADVEKLRRDYEVTMRVLRRLDIPNAQYATFVNELVAGAVVGLKGPNYNLQSGRDQLENVQKDMLGRARKNRDAYLVPGIRAG